MPTLASPSRTLARVTAGLAVAALTLAPACGGGGGRSFCELARELEERELSTDERDLEARFEEVLGVLDDLVGEAPDEIVGDVAAVRDGIERFVRGTGGLDARFEAASREVSDYLADECGIERSETGL